MPPAEINREIEQLFDDNPGRYTEENLRLFQRFKDALNAGEIFDDAFIEPDAQSDVAQHPRSQTHIIRIGMPVTYETSNMERLSCYPRHLDSIALPSPVQPEKKFPSLLCTCALQRAHAA